MLFVPFAYLSPRLCCAVFFLIGIPFFGQNPGIAQDSPPSNPVTAEAEALAPLSADRPGYGVSVGVVEPGTLQAELGVNVDYDHGIRLASFGTPLLRYGITRNLELRLAGDGYLSELPPIQSNPFRNGIGDLAAGQSSRCFPKTGGGRTLARN